MIESFPVMDLFLVENVSLFALSPWGGQELNMTDYAEFLKFAPCQAKALRMTHKRIKTLHSIV